MRLPTVLCLLTLIRQASTCASQCACISKHADCRFRGLKWIPSGIPRDTIALDLRNNRMENISKGAFRRFPSLRTLQISYNRIKSFEQNAFDGLKSIRSIFAVGNQLKSLPSLSSQPLKKMVHIDLRDNDIETIDRSFYRNLPHIRQIDLSRNKLQILPDSLLTLKNLIVSIDGNPLNCDCRWWKHHKMFKKRFKGPAICYHPEQLRGKNIKSLRSYHFGCLEQPLLVKISKLECQRNNNQSSCPSKMRKVKNRRRQRIKSNVPESSIREAGNITLPECKSERRKRQVRITNHLRFTLKPKSRLYREGSTAKLNCEVVGRTRPVLEWFFKNKRIKRSRKYEMNFERTIINIYPFLEADVGLYTCVATNIHGRIQASASLQIISSSPPEIFDGPHSQILDYGLSAKFRCVAHGNPQPKITWLFDGIEIPTLRGHFQVSKDGSELMVTNVTTNDEGIYSCMAGNTVGSMMADGRLTVKTRTGWIEIHPPHRTIDENVIRNAVNEASQNIEKAINSTRNKSNFTSPNDLIKWFHFSAPQTIELGRAREIYEESIRLIQKHIEKGLQMSTADLSSNVSFESVLTKSHMDLLMELAGCSGTLTSSPCDDTCFHAHYRTFDGQCNNFEHTMWGASYMRFRRLLLPIYENGFNIPIGWDPKKLYNWFPMPNPRMISRKVVRSNSITEHQDFSSMLMQWGQFIDHDLDFTATAISRHAYVTGALCNSTCENSDPCFNIPLAPDDGKLDRRQQNTCIEFERSSAVCGSGETSLIYRNIIYREQMNIITSYIDGSGIYGSTPEHAYELRELNPNRGLLRFDTISSSGKEYLPFEIDSLMDCRRNYSVSNPIRCFLAGDYRANEQVGLTAMHTLFLRQHNKIAKEVYEMNPSLDGETIFHETRRIVGAMLQHITFNDWLPKVLGKEQFDRLIGTYKGYRADVDASISNAFATAAFRFGHTLINPVLYRLNNDFNPIASGHLLLRDAFFSPEAIFIGDGIDPIIRGLFGSRMKRPLPNELLNMELTEELFNRGHEVALDLAAINIQRGRDHGLPGYTQYRKWCGLSDVNIWTDLYGLIDMEVIAKLRDLYGHPGNIDLFVGGIVENRKNGSLIGPTFSCIIAEQFKRLRDGDRFWYEKLDVFNEAQLHEIKKTTLARIICDNGDNIDRIQSDVFVYSGQEKRLYAECSEQSQFNISIWRSCCKNTCAITDDSNILRSRRLERTCKWRGNIINNHRTWSENCELCTCRNGEVTCLTIPNCNINSF